MLYKIIVHTIGGSEDVMENYLPIILNQSTNNWFLSLTADTIRSWDDLKRAFIANYMAKCEQPSTKYDLEKHHQTFGEPLGSFIRCFSEPRNSIPNITNSEAIATFTKGFLYHE